jgi:hypothetical protein
MKRAGDTTRRGYGTAHQALRKRWAKLVEAGEVQCARCHRWIYPGSEWDLDHDDNDRGRYLGPSHSRCNRAAAGRKSARAKRRERIEMPEVRARVRRTSRIW